MSLFSNFLKQIFGENRNQPEPSQSPQPVHPLSSSTDNDYMERWEKEREERITAAEERLKDWLLTSLMEKGAMPFSWESGNDEAFLTFEDKNEDNAADFEDLEEYIIDKLDIPDAGEFQMNGNGNVYLENNLVRAKYSSTMKVTIDYNEETDEEIFSEEIQDSGDKVLFTV